MRRVGRRGQSIVEYLIIAAVVIAAVIGISVGFREQLNALFTNSQGRVTRASNSVTAAQVEVGPYNVTGGS